MKDSMMIDQRERIEHINEFEREPTGLAKDVVRVMSLIVRAKAADEIQSELGRRFTDAEIEWIADGWEPASVKMEL